MAAVACDVLVIGGGPAGSAAAAFLARRGHVVRLVERATPVRHALAESIPPSARRLLTTLGLLDVVEAAGFHPWTGNTVIWGDTAPRVEAFARGDYGYQVPRDRFDALLLAAAERTGVGLTRGLARDVDLDAGVAHIDTERGPATVPFRFVLDCSGRAGVIARRGFRLAGNAPHTVALAAVWRRDAWPLAERGHTVVASYEDGWAWSVPTDDTARYVTVMVDPDRTRLSRGAPPVDVYRAELAKARVFQSLVEGATLVDGPFGADATVYSAERYAGGNMLLVGDAASFIDPLSSFGVKKALASAWLAGVAVHTALSTPGMTAEALSFFDRRERTVHASYTRQAATFARGARASGAAPFWQARSAFDAETDDPADPAALARDPAVLAALADLQRRPSLDLRPGNAVRTVRRAVVRDDLIVMDDHLQVPDWPDGVRYIRNIDLMLLSRLACEHRDAGELYEALFRAEPGVSLPDFLGALATLVARGALKHAD